MKTSLKVLRDLLVFTKEGIARVLGITVKSIARMMIWWSGIWILVKGKRPRLYKKSIFEKNFVDFRRASSAKYTAVRAIAPKTVIGDAGVTNKVTEYYVGAGVTDNRYTVTVTPDRDGAPRYKCQCNDYEAIARVIKTGACKHIYAVLTTQNFSSLKDAMTAGRADYARAAIGL